MTRTWLLMLLALLAGLPVGRGIAADPAVMELGSRRELFVDQTLIEQLSGTAKLVLHTPQPREVVLVADQPWEGNTSAYFTIFADGGRFRMYYRGAHFDEQTKKSAHQEVACYAESTDGVQWTKPALGLVEFAGSKQNNIVWDGTHNFTPFRDANPACPPQARYKALASGPGGLHAFQSPDGIHWSPLSDKAVITKGAFDSQNLAFWDPQAQVYREYHRGFRDGVRDIMTGTSTDFRQWTDPVYLSYPGAPKEHLYTNAIQPCDRAPHLLLGFPTRFLPQRGQQVEPTFMTSRDGLTFQRWTEALIPVTAPENRDGNRSNYMAWGLLTLPGQDREHSVYATEAYYKGPAGRLRRFTYRIDGFVSVQATAEGGTLLTKPLQFTGAELTINYRAAPAGSVRVEIVDANSQPLPGFGLADCQELRGDAIDQVVTWKGNADVSALAGRPVRLRFALREADVFAFQFRSR